MNVVWMYVYIYYHSNECRWKKWTTKNYILELREYKTTLTCRQYTNLCWCSTVNTMLSSLTLLSANSIQLPQTQLFGTVHSSPYLWSSQFQVSSPCSKSITMLQQKNKKIKINWKAPKWLKHPNPKGNTIIYKLAF